MFICVNVYLMCILDVQKCNILWSFILPPCPVVVFFSPFRNISFEKSLVGTISSQEGCGKLFSRTVSSLLILIVIYCMARYIAVHLPLIED